MSRVGKQPIIIPEKVDVKIDGTTIRVKGPLGELKWQFPETVKVEQKEKEINVTLNSKDRASFGMVRARIANLVTGVEKGFTKDLEIHGLGFKAALKGQTLVLNLGYSHQVEYAIPDGVKVAVDKKATKLAVSGIDKEVVGETAAQIRILRKPEPYKGKGIRYAGERIHRKSGKTAAGASGGGK
jgi:large subunit ribosomal protein L6